MAEDEFESSQARAGKSSNPAEALALGAALGSPHAAEEAREYLRLQSRLAELQAENARLENENLRKLDEYELSHLRWRRFNDQMRGALQIMLVLVGAAIVIAIAAAVWNAHQADGLVVDSFAVPPDYAQSGISGSVVADDMAQKIAAIHDFANGYSLAHSKDVRQARDDVKVEIPETGISISEAWRYLKSWLGNERHLYGNLRSLPDGKVALTMSLDGSNTFTLTGTLGELDRLEQKAAERVFVTVDPINYVLYLAGNNRGAETLQWAARETAFWTDNRNLAESYSLYADMTHGIVGDVRRALALTTLAITLDPKSTPPHMERLNDSRDLGHDEDVLREARIIAGLRQEDNVVSWQTGIGFAYVAEMGAKSRAIETGDFTRLSTMPCITYCSVASALLLHAEAFARLHDPHQAAELLARAQTLGGADPVDITHMQYLMRSMAGDHPASVQAVRQFESALLADRSHAESLSRLRVQIRARPLLAVSLARNGALADARAAAEAMPSDCYSCLRARGVVDGLGGNAGGAAYWFTRAVAAAPSVPFAYADWGEMLLHQGRYDAAIAKFALASQKGPHFADPLEMWGEALMQKNRSDLALAKFEEADKYAPNWGRLHLEWGKALTYAGKKGEAKKQFAVASALDLSAEDKTQLAKMDAAHG